MATVVEGDQKALFSIATTPRCMGGRYSFSLDCSTLLFIRTLYCWVLSKEVSNTIFKVFGMKQPGSEPRSRGTLANTLPTRLMCRLQVFSLQVYLVVFIEIRVTLRVLLASNISIFVDLNNAVIWTVSIFHRIFVTHCLFQILYDCPKPSTMSCKHVLAISFRNFNHLKCTNRFFFLIFVSLFCSEIS